MEYEVDMSNTIHFSHVLLKLLDWPFLLFLLVLIFFYVNRKKITALFDKPNIKFTWGDRSIELSELGDNLDQDIDPIRERVEALEEQLSSILKNGSKPSNSESEEPTEEEIKKVVQGPLQNKKYRYRTVMGVAREANISKSKAQRILRNTPDIKIVTARDGKELYRVFHNPRNK